MLHRAWRLHCCKSTLLLRFVPRPTLLLTTMPKRKRSSAAGVAVEPESTLPPSVALNGAGRRTSSRNILKDIPNPEDNADVIEGRDALRASPDSDVNDKITPAQINGNAAEVEPPKKTRQIRGKKTATKIEQAQAEAAEGITPTKVKKEEADEEIRGDPEGEEDEGEADPEEVKQALTRPPPVHSDYLPLPWKGRLGYACLCTYLRFSNPPIFCSRTTRIASILEHRHPLKDPTQPEHPTKNRPDKDQPADIRRGQAFIEQLCLANVRDMAKLIRWNDRFGIKFLRLSSEAFPFASHAEYGYKLAPFAAEALAEVGKVAAELGHRLTVHPGQFTQLGSPRKPVIDASIRDLEYHDEMLSLLKLPPQQDRDAVMVLHMGGVFGDKAATLDRFRENYARLSPGIKRRLVLENDDVSWSVHDLLPVCQELNIPLVLDFHHHNIIHDTARIREGTHDIIALFPAIAETWRRKGITQKMHYSEPTPAAVTARQRRKHNPRVATLPPCPPDMDLMIEAKDKEQAVFELMRTFKLPGHALFNDVVPHVREDDNKAAEAALRKSAARVKKGNAADEALLEPELVPEEEIGMGGPQGRVYWPPGMEEWLRPVKRQVKKKEGGGTPAKGQAKKGAAAAAEDEEEGESVVKDAAPAKVRKAATAAKKATPKGRPAAEDDEEGESIVKDAAPAKVRKAATAAKKATPKGKAAAAPASKRRKLSSSPEAELSASSDEDEDDETVAAPARAPAKKRNAPVRSGRGRKRVNYNEDDSDSDS